MRAFTNATIWTAAGPPIERGVLLVDGSSIVSVGTDPAPDDAEVVDCSGRFILPGLVDCHAHTGIWGEGARDDYDGNEVSEAVTAYVRTLDSIYPEDVGFEDARRGGVTTLGITHGSANPIGGQVTVVKAAGLVADEMVIREPAGLKMALGENPKRVGEHYKRAPNTRMGAAYVARKAFVEALEYARDREHFQDRLAEQERKPEPERAPVREPMRDLGKEVLLKVLNREIPVRNHAHRMDDIRTAIRLAEEFGYDLVIDHATEAYRIAEEIVARGIPVAVGPLFGDRAKRELNRQTPATPGLLVAAGATVAIMTDAPFNPVNTLRDNVVFAIREGLPADRALETVTINPARILGVADRVGSLEPAKDADFAVWSGDPWDARTKPLETYIDGERVFSADGPYIPA
ncbi:MAG TPA: amidohydrolase [Acidimicrobiia bacterium]|nr:amidohydrolase [Acidimicrobiia bacterium]